MKKTFLTLTILLLLSAISSAATVSMNTSNTDTLKIIMDQNDNVASFHFSLTGLTIRRVISTDPNKAIDFYGSKVIVYSLDNTVVKNGDIALIEFNVPEDYGSYPVVITPLSGATAGATPATISKGADGLVSITFSAAECLVEKDSILDRPDSMGVDINGDGVINTVDFQIMVNNKRK